MKRFIKEMQGYAHYFRKYYGKNCAYITCSNRGYFVELSYVGTRYPDVAFVCKSCKGAN